MESQEREEGDTATSAVVKTGGARELDKSMREWHAYKGLETTVKNMLTSLRAVGELQNSAIRDRHWSVF